MEESRSHSEKDCESVNMGMGGDMLIKCMKDSCCFQCGLPGDMCEEYESRSCQGPNFVQSLVMIRLSWGCPKILKCIKGVAGREFELKSQDGMQELKKWLGQKRQTLGQNGSNMFAVFCLGIKNGL